MNFFHSYYLLKIFFTLYCIFCIFISLMNIQKLTICMITLKKVFKTIKTVKSYFFPRLYLVGPEFLSGRDFMVPPHGTIPPIRPCREMNRYSGRKQEKQELKQDGFNNRQQKASRTKGISIIFLAHRVFKNKKSDRVETSDARVFV